MYSNTNTSQFSVQCWCQKDVGSLVLSPDFFFFLKACCDFLSTPPQPLLLLTAISWQTAVFMPSACVRLSSALGVCTLPTLKGQLLNNDSSIMAPHWVKVSLFAAGRSCVSVFLEWHLAGIMFHVWDQDLFLVMIPSLFLCLHYPNQFYNSRQSTLEQEVCTPNNSPLNHIFLPLLLPFICLLSSSTKALC